MKTISYFDPRKLTTNYYYELFDAINPYYKFFENSISNGYINNNELNKIRNLLNDWYDTLNDSQKLLLEIEEE